MRKLTTFLVALVLLTSLAFGQQGGMGPGPGTPKSGGGGGPTDFVTDTFTEGSDGSITAHTGETGASYTINPHGNYSGTQIAVDAATDRIFNVAGTGAVYASGAPPSADYKVCADFWHISTLSVSIAVSGRQDTTDDTMYIGQFLNSTDWRMRKIVGGTQTTLGTNSTNQIPSVGNFKTGCLIMTGDQISFTVNGSIEIGPVTDSAITAAGKAGVRFAGASTASTGLHMDNLSAQ